MSAIQGWAWMHHRKIYMDRFKHPPPDWVNELKLHKRTNLVKAAVRLGWPLPAVDLSEDKAAPNQ